MDEDFFWGDLLANIRRRELVTVVGPDVTLVEVDGREQTFTSLIGKLLLERYHLTPESEIRTTGDAVTLILSEFGRDEVDRLYRVIYDIIDKRDWKPGKALRELAAIKSLRLFVSTTPDQLLAKAINEVRFEGRRETRELSFSPNKGTRLQRVNQSEGSPTDTVVLSLFGKAESTPQYAIHDEDLLEWLCALLGEAASFPKWLSDPLKRRPTLFIGYDVPDWIGRYLLRISSDTPLSQLRNQQFFFVGSSTSDEAPLSRFLSAWCRRATVQHLAMEPTAFVAKLRKRWEREYPTWPTNPSDQDNQQDPRTVSSQGKSIFISYIREDVDAARRLNEAITELGGDVWFDETRLLPAALWKDEILDLIKRGVQLFVAVISKNTEHAEQGFVFNEWNAAVERAQGMMNRRFIVPVVIDEDFAGDPSHLQQIPRDFLKLNFGRAPGGVPDAGLRTMLTEEIRDMRSPTA